MRLMSDAELDKLIADYAREEGAPRASRAGLAGLGGFSFKSLFKTAANAAIGFATGGPAGAAAGAAKGFAEQRAEKEMESAQRVAQEQAAAESLAARGINMRNPKARLINQQMVARARIEKQNRATLIKFGIFGALGIGALFIITKYAR